MEDLEDTVGCEAIIKSIEQRWAKADQEIFIAAIILNPFYQTSPFSALSFLNNAGIHALLGRLWVRFYRTEPHPDFHQQVTNYLNRSGFFQHLDAQCGIAKVAADRKVSLNPLTRVLC